MYMILLGGVDLFLDGSVFMFISVVLIDLQTLVTLGTVQWKDGEGYTNRCFAIYFEEIVSRFVLNAIFLIFGIVLRSEIA